MPVVFALAPGELGHFLSLLGIPFGVIAIIVVAYVIGHHFWEEKKAEEVRKANMAAFELQKRQEAQKKSASP